MSTTTTTTITREQITFVYEALRDRAINPEGKFDNSGRWYPSEAENVDLGGIRAPSRAWPYSYLAACRTRKHVAALAAKSPELFWRHYRNAEVRLAQVAC